MVDWKKEIKLSDLVGKKKAGREPEPAFEEETEPKTSIWKREITFGRKKEKPGEAAPAPVEPTPEAAAEPPVVPPPPPQPPARQQEAAPIAPAAPVAEPRLAQPGFEPRMVEPVTRKVIRDESRPEVLEPFVPSPSPPPQPSASPLPEHEPSAAQHVPQAAAEPVAARLPGQHAETPTPESAAPTPHVPAAAPPMEPPPVAEATPPAAPAEPVEIVHPPVPADQLPPIDDDEGEERTPFYKRRVTIGRRSGEAKTREKEPKRPRGRGQDSVASRKKLPKSLIGLKVGSSQIAAARVANNGAAELLQLARRPLEAGVVVGGELRDPDSLADALKAFFAEHKLPKRGVRLGIANNRIGVRAFEIAGVDDPRQLENAIRFRAQEVLPIPLEEAVLDYTVLGERVTEEGETVRRILLVVAYRELVDRYLDACRKAGITLAGIDLEGFALLRSLQPPQDDANTDAALVAVTVGHERSTFAVSDGRVCEFTRVLEWGGAALNVAIARVLDLSPSEAEPIKLALSLRGGEVPAGLSEEQAATAREAMGREIQSFARELVSSLQFYQSQPGSLGIGEIMITGGTADLPGLAEELERLIGVVVRVGDPLRRVRVAKKFNEPEQLGSFAVAIGLGIED
jgi:type IV pilus assembly protein PilM